ncbi:MULTISPECIES: helix-turn-helix domain-containing protein [Rhodococcus]|jgi:transcriptional regulator with XRE-family HTH domain|uniref:helix-turn-helix domain-containing protein n=1 Tax=Rhodococcus TaxID=1827 RepID=UPI001AE6C9D3|nr:MULTISPECIES: helix-turn-helix transcriptional regulator [Rhodococcus]MBY6382579.1 helix-turn-helix domain-containing protein [Rhodococcus erythropolis]MBY6389549.1 helix-turn-helix domain-containing protein [Rhodococcus erythropolis]WCT06190.1 helix-turn-helix transcriptional regulator [Rhodococcus qingshengii]
MVSSDAERNFAVSRRVLRGFDPTRLIQARKDKGMSRADMARLAGLNGATVQRWESGSRSPQVDTLSLVAKALQMSISDFVDVPEGERFPGDWRVLRGLTQPQLGKLAGISTSEVGRIERGEVPLTDASAKALSRQLEISIEELRASHERARNRPAGTPA